jgi:hypothetical protein
MFFIVESYICLKDICLSSSRFIFFRAVFPLWYVYIMNTICAVFLFGLWGYWRCGHFWPIVPASDDSEDDCGEAEWM